MTQEEKQLLLNDLCGRLPYDTWVQYEGEKWLITGYGHGRVLLLPSVFSSVSGPCPLVEEVHPYLRPMSSMTNEEGTLFRCELPAIAKTDAQLVVMRMELFLKGHLDFNHLIEKGLALEAPEDMYKTE